MQITRATISDLEQVLSWVTSQKSCRLWAGPAVSYPVDINVLIEEIGFDESNSYVGLISGEIVGFGQVIVKSPETRHLARIIVNPEKRGMGFGRQLVGSLVDMASDGDSILSLNVYRANKPAMTVYQAFGFREDASRSTVETVYMVMP